MLPVSVEDHWDEGSTFYQASSALRLSWRQRTPAKARSFRRVSEQTYQNISESKHLRNLRDFCGGMCHCPARLGKSPQWSLSFDYLRSNINDARVPHIFEAKTQGLHRLFEEGWNSLCIWEVLMRRNAWCFSQKGTEFCLKLSRNLATMTLLHFDLASALKIAAWTVLIGKPAMLLGRPFGSFCACCPYLWIGFKRTTIAQAWDIDVRQWSWIGEMRKTCDLDETLSRIKPRGLHTQSRLTDAAQLS